MRRLLIHPVLLLSLFVGNPAFSADFQKGLDAYNRRDYATVLREWKPLAEQGNTSAQLFLGAMYYVGQGVTQNYKTALKWYRLAAEQGNAGAQKELEGLQRKIAQIENETKPKDTKQVTKKTSEQRIIKKPAERWSLPTCPGSSTSKFTISRNWTNCVGTFNIPSGKGKGNNYVGEWKEGKRHGQGTLTYAKGDKYVGEFKNGKRHGQGTLTYSKGDKYVGEFQNGKRHGQGTLTYADGRVVEGVIGSGKFKHAKKVFPKVYAEKTKTPSSDVLQKALDAYSKGDVETALKIWTTLAEQGNADAQFNLGFLYEKGDGVPQNDKTAIKWYRLAAEQGYARAQFNLGLKYKNGQGVPQDYKIVVKWYTLAAKQGDALAQVNLGVMYGTGQGVPQDYKTAVKWFTLSAKQGLSRAQYNLGVMYKKGDGVSQDYAEAVKWYRLAAEQGNAGAQGNLGAMYAYGFGAPKNYVEAYKWGHLAAVNGNELGKKLRNDIAKKMTPVNISKARDLARECEKKNYKGC